MGKKIAVFTAVWNVDYLFPFLQGLQQDALAQNADLYIFHSYGDSDREFEAYSNGEYNVFFLPNLQEFDGALIAANNVGAEPWVERVKQEIDRYHIPYVGVEQRTGLEYVIGVDNYWAMYAVVDYLVRDKHCRTLNYIGGPSNNPENQLRKAAFLDVLKACGLPCDPRRVRDYSFLSTDGIQAYRDFKEMGLERPDAVVCANDNMAIGYLQGAEADGLTAPEDFLITGFDNSKLAQQYYPRITSVDRSPEALGRASLKFLNQLMENRPCPPQQYVPFQIMFGWSTGEHSQQDDYGAFRRELYSINTQNSRMRLHLKHLRTALLGRRSPEEFVEIISRFAPMMGMNRFMIAMEARRIVENSENEKRFYGNYDDEQFRVSGSEYSGLIPPQWRREDGVGHTYLFSSCHCNGKQFGYWVTIDNLDVIRQNMLSEWMLALDNAMENLRQNLHLQIMNRKLSQLYRQDSLTGLYNRFALKELGEQLMLRNRDQNKSTLLIFVDMDSLKRANDVYGHDVGDLALKTIADALQQVCSQCLDFVVRYGGDEFLLLGTYPGEEETRQIMQRVEQTISSLGTLRKLPFELSASTGSAKIPPDTSQDMESFIRQADQRMYRRKTEKKKARNQEA